MAADKDEGFKINDQITIKKLSGPVSMRILVPNIQSDYFKKYKNAPVLIMLGDVHFSDENICITGPGVSRVARVEFLQKLCAVLAEDEIIDFYIEGTDVSTRTEYVQGQEGSLMAILNIIIACNKPDDQKTQPYKDISKVKWHHTDIRFWTSETKELKEMPYKKDKKYCSMLDFLLQKIERDELFSKTPNCKTFAITFRAYRNVLRSEGYSLESNTTANVLQIYHKLVNNCYSIVNFLISKIKDLTDRTFIRNQIKAYIEYVYGAFCKKVGKSPDKLGPFIIDKQKQIVDLFNGILDNDIDNDIDNLYDQNYIIYSDYVVTMDAIKLDVMTMVKSFTQMLQNGNSIINICYFGEDHVKNMCAFMPSLLQSKSSHPAYTQVLDVSAMRGNPNQEIAGEPGRCLDFTNKETPVLSQILSDLRAVREKLKT
jgi:hypothetical protein